MVLNLLIMVPLLLLFGEVTPKTIAVTNPLQLSTRVIAAPMTAWLRLVAPLRWLVRLLAERVTTLLVGPEKAPENILKVDELRTLVEEVVERGELHATERILIDNRWAGYEPAAALASARRIDCDLGLSLYRRGCLREGGDDHCRRTGLGAARRQLRVFCDHETFQHLQHKRLVDGSHDVDFVLMIRLAMRGI